MPIHRYAIVLSPSKVVKKRIQMIFPLPWPQPGVFHEMQRCLPPALISFQTKQGHL